MYAIHPTPALTIVRAARRRFDPKTAPPTTFWQAHPCSADRRERMAQSGPCRFSSLTEGVQGSSQARFSACSTQSTIAAVGIAPDVRAISSPFLIMIMLGMLRIP